MVSQAEKGVRFRALHERGEAFVIPNPWDVGSARMLGAQGFEALATTSAGFAYSLGRVDGQVTRDEKLAHCREICSAMDLPVSADLENCFADTPEGVAETVLLAAKSGLVGCSIEDYTIAPEPRIYEFELAVARVKGGVEAAKSLEFPFTVTARAENVLRGMFDIDEAIRRLKAYEMVGANVVYAPGLRTLGQVGAVVGAVDVPVNVLATKDLEVAGLSAAGVSRISLGSSLYLAAIGGFIRATEEIKQQGTFTELGKVVPSRDVAQMMKSRGEI